MWTTLVVFVLPQGIIVVYQVSIHLYQLYIYSPTRQGLGLGLLRLGQPSSPSKLSSAWDKLAPKECTYLITESASLRTEAWFFSVIPAPIFTVLMLLASLNSCANPLHLPSDQGYLPKKLLTSVSAIYTSFNGARLSGWGPRRTVLLGVCPGIQTFTNSKNPLKAQLPPGG